MFAGSRQVTITRDRGQWIIGVALDRGGKDIALDVLNSARLAQEWMPSAHHAGGASLPKQLPDGLPWFPTLPQVVSWLEEPGAEAEARAADKRAGQRMLMWWRRRASHQ